MKDLRTPRYSVNDRNQRLVDLTVRAISASECQHRVVHAATASRLLLSAAEICMRINHALLIFRQIHSSLSAGGDAFQNIPAQILKDAIPGFVFALCPFADRLLDLAQATLIDRQELTAGSRLISLAKYESHSRMVLEETASRFECEPGSITTSAATAGGLADMTIVLIKKANSAECPIQPDEQVAMQLWCNQAYLDIANELNKSLSTVNPTVLRHTVWPVYRSLIGPIIIDLDSLVEKFQSALV